MAITTVFFDLDATLLPMDQDEFVRVYLHKLIGSAASWGYEPQKFQTTLLSGIRAMQENTGAESNEQVFWDCFTQAYGAKAREDIPRFDEFYRTDFQTVQESCGFQPLAKPLIRHLQERNKRIVLATNPLFPQIATYSRVRWAGIAPEDFEIVTTYENSRRCKPNLEYYRELLAKLQAAPEECLMVGNDVGEDMVAKQLGMQVFLVTDCLINRSGADIRSYPHGSFSQLFDYIQAEL